MNSQFYQKILQNVDEGIYFVDRNRCITFWNKAAERITGYQASEILGMHCYDNILNHVDAEGNELCLAGCPLQATINDGIERSSGFFLHHKKGHRVPVYIRTVQLRNDEGKMIGALETFSDMTENFAIIEDNEKLKELAMHDQLTGLANRYYLEEFLESKEREFKRFGVSFAFLIADIDHFKLVNDFYGHDVGDKVIRMVSDSLRGGVRGNDFVARYGGEEFVVILSGVKMSELPLLAERLRMLIEHSSYQMENGEQVTATISIGGAIYELEDTLESLIKRADCCLYKSKEEGRNRVTIDTACLKEIEE